MKTLQELTVNRSAIEPKVILKQVQVAGRARRRARQLCKINRDMIAKKSRSIYVPSRGQLTASTVSEGSSPSDQTITYSTTSISAVKYGIKVQITQEQIDGSELDVINDTINEAGEALAEKEDNIILDAFELAGAQGTSVNATVSGSLQYEDILSARLGVLNKYFVPTILLIHPDQETDLLKDTRFIDASKYGAREPILNGEIGKIAGLKILVSGNLTTANAIVVDPTRAAWLAVKRDVELKKDDEPSTDSLSLYFYQEYGIGVVNKNAVAIITSC